MTYNEVIVLCLGIHMTTEQLYYFLVDFEEIVDATITMQNKTTIKLFNENTTLQSS